MRRISGYRRLYLTVFLISLSAILSAGVHPPGDWPVRDEIHQLDTNSLFSLRRICTDLKRDTGAELVVLITRTTSGEDPQRYGVRLFNNWGIGRAGIDDGVLLMFAMSDRRGEIIPGNRYKSLLNSSVSADLIRQHAIPSIKAGRPNDGVINTANEIARQVRDYERTRKGYATPAPQPAGKRSSSVWPTTSTTSRSTQRPSVTRRPSSSPTPSAPPISGWFGPTMLPILRVVFLAGAVVWAAAVIFYFFTAFSSGVLLFPKTPALLGFGLSGAALTFLGFRLLSVHAGVLDQFAAGSGGVGLLTLLFCGSHICPRCNKWMSITRVTLVSATYSSSGRGECTEHCEHCRYHNVYTYTIPRRTRSRSSSGSRRSGGGRSSGGGGGASW
ncbi:MAG TPA: TPM domain-containing protein [Candidatus Ozemobacteraceae bacterium]|nr:TPM domain-containing protein [Candidatus Ozemobacteraceae bacterium]